MEFPRTVILLGASVRALAASARAAGHHLYGVDLFGDQDLRALADRVQVIAGETYPEGFEAILRSWPIAPWIYTGGIENHPDLIDRCARISPLWGNGGAACRAARNWDELSNRLARVGIRFPETTHEAPISAVPGEWLVKPTRGTGGFHIREWSGEPIESGYMLQRRIAGEPCSAVFAGVNGQAHLLGVTIQLLARSVPDVVPDSATKGYRYVGSMGPIKVAESTRRQLERVGCLCVQEIGLRGVFGVDWIDDGGEVVVIEINPRYPASAEVLERSSQVPLFAWHRAAFSSMPIPADCRGSGCVGKLVVYASSDGNFVGGRPRRGTWWADVPIAPSRVDAGQPILTILTRRDTVEEMRQHLVDATRRFLSEQFRPS